MKIILTERPQAYDYTATLDGTKIWEAGRTANEAIGKLVQTLSSSSPSHGVQIVPGSPHSPHKEAT